MTNEEAARKALDMCLIAGNHLGTHKADYWPPSDANWQDAMEALVPNYGVKEYDTWTAWALIMRASKLMRGAKVISLETPKPLL